MLTFKVVPPPPHFLYFLTSPYKSNNQTRGGLGRVCATGMYRCIGHVDFPKFQIGVFVKWKAPSICPKWTVKFFHSTRMTNCGTWNPELWNLEYSPNEIIQIPLRIGIPNLSQSTEKWIRTEYSTWIAQSPCGSRIQGRDPFNQNSNRSDREKWSSSKGGPVFSKLFRLDQTDPLSFGPKFPEILVEWIAPFTLDSLTWGDNLVPRFHSVLRWKVRSPFPLAVGELGTRLMGR